MNLTLKFRIIEVLSKDVSALYSISDIAKILNVAYSHTHNFIIQLKKEDCITIKKIGNVSVCILKLTSPTTIAYLSIIESKKALAWSKKNPQSKKIFSNIRQMQDNVHSVLIKNKRIILIIPENLSGVNFSIFKNRIILTKSKLKEKQHYYKDAIILHGAEKFWSFMGIDHA